MDIELSQYVGAPGTVLQVIVRSPDVSSAKSANAQLNRVGIRNPQFSWATGISVMPDAGGSVKFSLEIPAIEPGFYQLLVGFTSGDAQIVGGLCSPESSTRTVLEVSLSPRREKSKGQILEELTAVERALEAELLAGIDISKGAQPAKDFRILLFCQGVLVKTPMRFEHSELIPYGWLGASAAVDLVNRFTAEHVGGLHFDYTPDAPGTSPVIVHHFPRVRAKDDAAATQEAMTRTQALLQALSLHRGATGRVSDVVVLSHSDGTANLSTISEGYRGNLLGGFISGEDPDQIEKIATVLGGSEQWAYFAHLYSGAISEPSDSFRALRLWQVLEAIAESKNYKREPLTDLAGKLILNDGRRRKVSDAETRVYVLLKQLVGSGTSEICTVSVGEKQFRWDLWERVQIWYDFRNAVAHFGDIFKAIDAQKHAFDKVRRVLQAGGPQLLGNALAFLKDECTRLVTWEIMHA